LCQALLGEQPELGTFLEKPVIEFSGYSPMGLGSDMRHTLNVIPKSKYPNSSQSLDEFLQSERGEEIIIVSDQYDKEVFAFVLPKEDGYTVVRLKEYVPETELMSDIRDAQKYIGSYRLHEHKKGWHSEKGAYTKEDTQGFSSPQRVIVKRNPWVIDRGKRYDLQVGVKEYDSAVPLEEALDDLPEMGTLVENATLHLTSESSRRKNPSNYTFRLNANGQHEVLGKRYRRIEVIKDHQDFEAFLFKVNNDNGTYSLIRMREYVKE